MPIEYPYGHKNTRPLPGRDDDTRSRFTHYLRIGIIIILEIIIIGAFAEERLLLRSLLNPKIIFFLLSPFLKRAPKAAAPDNSG